MIYRPQFAYATPPGCRDEDYTYFFDSSNTPAFNQNSSFLSLSNIPLVLDKDAAFLLRAWKVGALRTVNGIPSGYVVPNVNLQLQDPYLNNLQDSQSPAIETGFPDNPVPITGGLLATPPVILEPEIYCPAGGCLLVSLTCGAVSGGCGFSQGFFSLMLYGVKRYKECG